MEMGKNTLQYDNSGISEMVKQSFAAAVNCQQPRWKKTTEIPVFMSEWNNGPTSFSFDQPVKLEQLLKWIWYFAEDSFASQG